MFERFTANARRAVVLAQEEARMLNHNYIGTEHLLLSLLKDRGNTGKALADTGVTHDEAISHVEDMIGRGRTQRSGLIPFTPAAKAVLNLGVRIALENEYPAVCSEHLLLALLADNQSVSTLTLHRCGVARMTVGQTLVGLMEADTTVPAEESGFVLAG